MSIRKERLDVISRILREEEISNQVELLQRLKEEGVAVTQATLSRDIRRLKVVKVHSTEGHYSYKLSSDISVHTEQVSSPKVTPKIEFSGNLAVVKTRPGYAMGIASDIDTQSPQEILGTIAGDDTILIIPREGYSRENIVQALARFIHY